MTTTTLARKSKQSALEVSVISGYRIADDAVRLLLGFPDGHEVLAVIGEYNRNNYHAEPLDFADGKIIPRLKRAEPGAMIKVCRLNAKVLTNDEIAHYRKVIYDIGESHGGRY